MKKLTISILALLALTLTGCEDKQTPEQVQQYLDDRYDGYIKTVRYKGHSYILYSEYSIDLAKNEDLLFDGEMFDNFEKATEYAISAALELIKKGE